jgi:arylsulfatase
MEKNYYKLAAVGLPLLLSFNASAAAPKEKPNIILILVDDLGYSDLGSYGSEIRTPNLDLLASQGIRFRQFYNNSISAPTRASLLTGQYASKAGMGYFDVNLGLPAYQGYLNKESLTLGEVLKAGGYQTYISGKWHVGSEETNRERPAQRGFDRSFGFLGGASTYLYNHEYAKGGNPGPLFEDNKPVSYKNDITFYLTDAITDHALQYISESPKDKPFFLYLAYNAPHWPLQAKQEDIAKYKGRYDIGWDSLHVERLNKQKALGLIPGDFKPAVKDKAIPDWNTLTYEEQRLWAHKMEVFAAMVDRVDQGVGKLLTTLGQAGKAENTLIIFISDNGAPAEDVTTTFTAVAVNAGPVGTAGSYESQSKNWSYVSNTPFREYKAFAHEGGISSPFIAWFPGKINAGQVIAGRGHIIDIAPTLYDVAGVAYPQNYNKVKTNHLPGISLKEVLYKGAEHADRPLFWERAGNRAVLSGKYKLVSIFPSYEWELYDLDVDRGETNNIAAQHKELVNRLSRLYFDWAKENDVVDFATIKPKQLLLQNPNGKGVEVY